MVVDQLASAANSSWKKAKENALVSEIQIGEYAAALAKPQTFMNLSGRSVAPLLKRLNIEPARMIVVHDDLDLPDGTIRVKSGGGDGGHRGVRSIAESLGFTDFARLRLGVGRPPVGVEPETYVLSNYPRDAESALSDLISRAGRAAALIVELGVDAARNAIGLEKIAAPRAAGDA
jgi:PTH1 family peptidyl-tRNA hydrolase